MTKDHARPLTIGIDLGGTSLRVASYSPAHGILQSLCLRTRLEAGPIAVVEDMCDAVQDLMSRDSSADWLGIGVGSPGPLELPAGRLHHPPNLPGWDGFPLLEELQTRLKPRIVLEGDANVAALAELHHGLGKDMQVDSLCMLTLGTGVGNGIVLNGKLWHGVTGMGGEAGHMTVDREGPECGCGNRGCLEVCASATAIVRAAERLIDSGKAKALAELKEQKRQLTAFDIATAARSGNEDAIAIYGETGRALGICLAGLINILNLPLYVVGGGVANSWDLLSPTLFEELELRSYVYRLTAPGRPAAGGMPNGGTQVKPAKLGDEAGLLGACLLPLESIEDTRAADVAIVN
ncbi:MAG: ROK family protein [Acidobacteriota bacterium]|nr:ROK family protein [Acidobacteriota bacterium]